MLQTSHATREAAMTLVNYPWNRIVRSELLHTQQVFLAPRRFKMTCNTTGMCLHRQSESRFSLPMQPQCVTTRSL